MLALKFQSRIQLCTLPNIVNYLHVPIRVYIHILATSINPSYSPATQPYTAPAFPEPNSHSPYPAEPHSRVHSDPDLWHTQGHHSTSFPATWEVYMCLDSDSALWDSTLIALLVLEADVVVL